MQKAAVLARLCLQVTRTAPTSWGKLSQLFFNECGPEGTRLEERHRSTQEVPSFYSLI